MLRTMKPLQIGQHITRIPIIQGGMGVGISLSGLASAVADNGGIGVIATAGIGMTEPDFYRNFAEANCRALRREIRIARAKTDGILGVNIMVALTDFENMVRIAVEEGIDIIFSGAGLPLNLPGLLDKNSSTALVPIVSSGRVARLMCKRWTDKYDYPPDALVLEGPRAGGHLGFKPDQIFDPAFSLEKLLADVVDAIQPFIKRYGVNIPIIAGGGIYSGEDIFRVMELGADGVQMGTRFVVTDECDASEKFKQTYLDCRQEDITIIKSPVGMPGRVIRNPFIDKMMRGEKLPFKCPYHCIITCDYKKSPYCIASALINAKKGFLNSGFPFAGANAYRTDKIVSVRELMETLEDEYCRAADPLKVVELSAS